MREEWISNVSHDMKTPLASIRGYAELLNDAQITNIEQMEYAQIIEKQSLHMQNLLDDLNLTMRLRHQQLPLTRKEVNMVPFIREIVIETLNTPQYEQANLAFEAVTENSLHQIDEHFMRRAIMNFLHNALLHNVPDVSVHVSVDENTITISDNGKGIAPEDLEHIFERYYRGTNTDKTAGTGLGTAIARDIIEAHGGTVTITSEKGKGTSVIIYLQKEFPSTNQEIQDSLKTGNFNTLLLLALRYTSLSCRKGSLKFMRLPFVLFHLILYFLGNSWNFTSSNEVTSVSFSRKALNKHRRKFL